jgi:hypothetical protein
LEKKETTKKSLIYNPDTAQLIITRKRHTPMQIKNGSVAILTCDRGIVAVNNEKRRKEFLVVPSVLDLGYSLRCSNVCIVYFCRELQTRQGLSEVCLQRANHDKHQSFRVAAQGELQQICEL